MSKVRRLAQISIRRLHHEKEVVRSEADDPERFVVRS
jgi:hypothetical protein